MHIKAINRLKNILLEDYKLRGELTPLEGEIDNNYKVNTINGNTFILKVFAKERKQKFLDFQEKILLYLMAKDKNLLAPKVIKTKCGYSSTFFTDAKGYKRSVMLLSWIPGRIWNQVNPHTENLRYELGFTCGTLSKFLNDFDHDFAHRTFEWDIAKGLWTKEYLNLFESKDQKLILNMINLFEKIHPEYHSLQKSIVHNDANNFNCIVSESVFNPGVIGLIDYGDAIYTQVINDLAISCCYAIMDFEDPLQASLSIVKGYNQAFSIEEEALACLYVCIGIRLIISVTKSRINKLKEPKNTYLQISEKSAWELLRKWDTIDSEFAHYNFREACGFYPHPQSNEFSNWALSKTVSIKSLFPYLQKEQVYHLDLSVSSPWLGNPTEFNDLDWFDYELNKIQKGNPKKIISGGYLEPRPLYTDSSYEKTGNDGLESRCIHLGVDFWARADTPVHSFLDGEVFISINDKGNKKYGGLVILQHNEDGIVFYTLYGHLSYSSILKLKVGDQLKKGEQIGFIGNSTENGSWSSHLHFQIVLSLLNYENDFPGVAYFNQRQIWKSICPDPNLLFKLKELSPFNNNKTSQILRSRNKYLGKGMSLQYQDPLHIVRGSGVYLIDQNGRKYLDTVNNVAHIGHENPRAVIAGQKQMGILNTNTRYLHENITDLAEKLKETLPPKLSIFHFVNSGSEANELALRMVKAATGSNQMLVSEVGYHGNTNGCIEISSYKFDGEGGQGAPNHIHVFPMPDSFRGKYRGADVSDKYANEIKVLISDLQKKGNSLGGFIIEPILSCGGQVELPDGFLKSIYSQVRKAGGLCISDEVQTGLGRLGKTFWGFELHGVIPDIITLGKPLGNGHPVAAVVCSEQVAEKFANGMEFFNTFGGNPVSCAIAKEVIEVVKEEKLQSNAFKVGEYLKFELNKLANKHPIIGSIRGQGLFLGIELVLKNRNPLAEQAIYLINRMKNYGILMSTDGPDNNVIKIKPPIIFSKQNAKFLIQTLSNILKEDIMRISSN